jgi:hypothetical protein
VERDVAAADSAKLFSLLREVAHAFSPIERCPGAESRRQTGERSYRCHSSGGRPAPSIRTARCLAGLSRHHIWYVPCPRLDSAGAEFSSHKQTFSSMRRAFRGNEPSGRVSFSIPVSPRDMRESRLTRRPRRASIGRTGFGWRPEFSVMTGRRESDPCPSSPNPASTVENPKRTPW